MSEKCKECGGSGCEGDSMIPCKTCNGAGVAEKCKYCRGQVMYVDNWRMDCPTCNGTGKIDQPEKCNCYCHRSAYPNPGCLACNCNGTGMVADQPEGLQSVPSELTTEPPKVDNTEGERREAIANERAYHRAIAEGQLEAYMQALDLAQTDIGILKTQLATLQKQNAELQEANQNFEMLLRVLVYRHGKGLPLEKWMNGAADLLNRFGDNRILREQALSEGGR